MWSRARYKWWERAWVGGEWARQRDVGKSDGRVVAEDDEY